MTLMDVAAIISAWLLGMFTHAMTDDSAAIMQCRIDLLNLERILESWRICDPHRRPSDIDKIYEIKKILENLKIHSAGLFIGFSSLYVFIDLSLTRIRKRANDPNGSSNQPNVIGIYLLQQWKSSHEKIWRFVNANLFVRVWLRIQCMFRP